MPYEPFERVALGRSGLHATRLGLGGASIGGLYRPVADADAVATIRHAWAIGIRLFDVAPLYGYGNAERRMGAALAGEPRDAFVLATKVGRLVVPTDHLSPADDVDHQALEGRDDAFYADTAGRHVVFDYSAEGVRRSIADSLERLRLDRVDVAWIHDPDAHWEAAIGEAYPELHRLREQGVVGAIGAGMNQSAMLARFVREADLDAILLAGRYTLLDQDALVDLLPACVERGVAVLVAGVMNSGVLADPRPGAAFDYAPAPPDVILRARDLAAACERHAVPVRAAAMQFPLAHPAVAGLIAGVRTPAHLDEYPVMLRRPIPAALWDELRATGLIHPAAPVPA
ncbi:MAG TPA: aldo/keto reductase [Candidatus Limnocylindrales bacterium]|jgi:D-threo-aldose 1-dehydrogenase